MKYLTPFLNYAIILDFDKTNQLLVESDHESVTYEKLIFNFVFFLTLNC